MEGAPMISKLQRWRVTLGFKGVSEMMTDVRVFSLQSEA